MTASGLNWSTDAIVAEYLGTGYRSNRVVCDALRAADIEWQRTNWHENEGSPSHIKALLKAARDARDSPQNQPPPPRFPNERGTPPLRFGGRQQFMDPRTVVPGEYRDTRVVSRDGAVDVGASIAHPIPKTQAADHPGGVGGIFPGAQKPAAPEDRNTVPFGKASRLRKGPLPDPHADNIPSKLVRGQRSVSPIISTRSKYRPEIDDSVPADLEPVEIDIGPERTGDTWDQLVEKSRATRRQLAAERGNPRIIERGDGSCVVYVGDD